MRLAVVPPARASPLRWGIGARNALYRRALYRADLRAVAYLQFHLVLEIELALHNRARADDDGGYAR